MSLLCETIYVQKLAFLPFSIAVYHILDLCKNFQRLASFTFIITGITSKPTIKVNTNYVKNTFNLETVLKSFLKFVKHQSYH